MFHNTPKALVFSRKLRHDQTDAEKILWLRLRNGQFGYKFRRQHPLGAYIVDFICIEKKLIIEVDGGQYNTNSDKQKTDYLKNNGFDILRFWNDEVMKNTEGVCQAINEFLQSNPAP